MDTDTEDLAGATVISCVLPKCDWSYIDRAPMVGDWFAASVSMEDRARSVERAIHAHILGDHRISEWLTRIHDLERALTCSVEALGSGRSAERCRQWLDTWRPDMPYAHISQLENLHRVVCDLAYVKAKELSDG